MNKPSRRTHKILLAATTPVAVVCAAALVYQASYAAFTGQTRNSGNEWATGSVTLTDDDSGSARFQVANMLPGSTETKCIKVTANASVPSIVKGYTVNPVKSNSDLEKYIKITIKDGTGGSFANCTGFVAENTLVTEAPLDQLALANTFAAGIGGWAVAPGVSSKTYEITWKFDTGVIGQADIDKLQGKSTGIDVQWEMQSN